MAALLLLASMMTEAPSLYAMRVAAHREELAYYAAMKARREWFEQLEAEAQ